MHLSTTSEATYSNARVDNYTCYKTHAKTLHHAHHRQDQKTHGMDTQELHVTKDPNYAPELDKTPPSGTGTTFAIQDDHRKPQLASHTWEVRHLSRSLDHGAIWDGSTERDTSTQQSASWATYELTRRSPSVTTRDYPTSPHTKPPRMTGFGAIRKPLKHFRTTWPEPRGELVKLWGYFDASHASCLKTRRSVTGILLFINSCPIYWYCKRQNTVETSTYGSELHHWEDSCGIHH